MLLPLGRPGLSAVALALAVFTQAPLAQTRPPADNGVAGFDAVSIRPNTTGDVIHSLGRLAGGRLIATNISVRELIRVAYDLHSSQVVGGPGWLDSARYDIVAKAEGTAPPSQQALRRLLADRFKLMTHPDVRRMPKYALLADRRPGPRLRASAIDCLTAAPITPASNGPADLAAGARQHCGKFIDTAPRFDAIGVSMPQLAAALSPHVGRVVEDRTRLAGVFDFELEWTPTAPRAQTRPYRLNGVEVDPHGPSIFIALAQQLGLRLQAVEGPAEVLVVDAVERPALD